MRIEYTAAYQRMNFLQVAIANLETIIAIRGDMDNNLVEMLRRLASLRMELTRHNWLGDAHSQSGTKMAKSFGTVIIGRRVVLNGGPSSDMIRAKNPIVRTIAVKRPVVLKGRHTSRKSGKFASHSRVRRVQAQASAWVKPVLSRTEVQDLSWKFYVERDLSRRAGLRVRETIVRGRVLGRMWAKAQGAFRLSKSEMSQVAAAICEVA